MRDDMFLFSVMGAMESLIPSRTPKTRASAASVGMRCQRRKKRRRKGGSPGPETRTRGPRCRWSRRQAPAPHLQVAFQLLADEFVVEDAAGHHERGLLGLLHHELRAGQGRRGWRGCSGH